jgi:hypothetical protein
MPSLLLLRVPSNIEACRRADAKRVLRGYRVRELGSKQQGTHRSGEH